MKKEVKIALIILLVIIISFIIYISYSIIFRKPILPSPIWYPGWGTCIDNDRDGASDTPNFPSIISCSKIGILDCNPNDITKWQNAEVYVDADGDRYYSTDEAGNPRRETKCIGNNIPQGYVLPQNSRGADCNDNPNNNGVNEWQLRGAWQDKDNDSYTIENSETLCVGNEQEYVIKNNVKYYLTPKGKSLYHIWTDYGRVFYKTLYDCNDLNPEIHQLRELYGPDNDGDGWLAILEIKIECIGETPPENYYLKESYFIAKDVQEQNSLIMHLADVFGERGLEDTTIVSIIYYMVTSETDCNDDNPNINPSAKEDCNNIDDNCDNIKDKELVDGKEYYLMKDSEMLLICYNNAWTRIPDVPNRNYDVIFTERSGEVEDRIREIIIWQGYLEYSYLFGLIKVEKDEFNEVCSPSICSIIPGTYILTAELGLGLWIWEQPQIEIGKEFESLGISFTFRALGLKLGAGIHPTQLIYNFYKCGCNLVETICDTFCRIF